MFFQSYVKRSEKASVCYPVEGPDFFSPHFSGCIHPAHFGYLAVLLGCLPLNQKCHISIICLYLQMPGEVSGFISVRYNHMNIGEDVLFVLSCTNVPIGSIVSFSCVQPGPEPPIELPATTVTNAQQFALGKL